MAKLDLESSIEAIGTLALAEPAPLMPGMPGSEIMPENATATSDPWSDLRDVQEEHKAAINASNLIAFVEGVSAEQKGDVLDSTQFAARAADAEFNRGSQIREWYDAYVEVLTKMGWVIEGFAFQQSRHAEGALLMSQEAIGVITATSLRSITLVVSSRPPRPMAFGVRSLTRCFSSSVKMSALARDSAPALITCALPLPPWPMPL